MILCAGAQQHMSEPLNSLRETYCEWATCKATFLYLLVSEVIEICSSKVFMILHFQLTETE